MKCTSSLDFIGNNTTDEVRLSGSQGCHEFVQLLLNIFSDKDEDNSRTERKMRIKIIEGNN